ncbi:MAG: type II secretion system protein GspM [Wenzhouxiangellaceae bacterium]|nr:type II secretion system protein GspM [Wenzhouxiangellaceae bacterium]
MKLLPDRKQSRPLAIGLLVIALIVVYFAGFHWFFQRHAELGREIGALEDRIARYKGMVEMSGPMRERLNELRASQQGSMLFLPGDDPNIAAAELIRMLRDWIAAEATEPAVCQIGNTSPRRSDEPELFQSVRLNVRMICPLDDFTRILHRMEGSVPVVFVDNVLLNQRMTPDQRTLRQAMQYGQIDIRFEMIGYINQPGPEADA